MNEDEELCHEVAMDKHDLEDVVLEEAKQNILDRMNQKYLGKDV
jgi:hypothetical protein